MITTEKSYTFKYLPNEAGSVDWESIKNIYDGFSLLEDCPQDPIHHAEGNVWVHTQMVTEELIKLEYYKNCSKEIQSLLFVSALLHDISKPECTQTVNGKITAPGHAKKGAQKSRGLLYRGLFGAMSLYERESIITLIRNHGLPIWFWDKPNPEKMVVQASLSGSLEQLATLSEADMLGRICSDQEEMLGRVNYFREFAKEKNCYTNPRPFENGLARFTYMKKEDGFLDYVPFDESAFEVTILSGLPGAGKDTWVREHGAGKPVVSLDEIRRKHKLSPKGNQGKVVQMGKELAKTYLRKKQSFIWNATNLIALNRSRLVNLMTTYGARVKIIYLETNYKNLLKRNLEREHALPEKVLEKFIDKLEVPQIWEAHSVEYTV